MTLKQNKKATTNMKFPNQAFFDTFKPVPGAISCSEACAIYYVASQAPKGVYMDIGSHAGKAAMAAAIGLRSGLLYMVDPIYDLSNREAWAHSDQRAPENLPWGYVNEEGFYDSVKKRITLLTDGMVTPILLGDYSAHALNQYDFYGYVFIDSDQHTTEMVMEEVKLIEDKVLKGGIVAFHDFENQFIGPKTGYEYLISTGKYERVEIPWESITAYVGDREEGNNSWHAQDQKYPCFVGAVRRIK